MPILVTFKHVSAEFSLLAKGGRIRDCQCFHFSSFPLRMLRVSYAKAWRDAAHFNKVKEHLMLHLNLMCMILSF